MVSGRAATPSSAPGTPAAGERVSAGVSRSVPATDLQVESSALRRLVSLAPDA